MEYVLSFFGLRSNFEQTPTSALKSAYWHLRDHFVPHQSNNYHPHILSHRSLALLSALLVTVKIFSIGLLSFGPVESAFSSAITEQNIVSLTNASRQSFGLTALTFNSQLKAAAQTKASDMLAKGYFSHETPDGKTPWDFITAAGYSYLSAGENLAVNFIEAEDVENAWMNSPGHKANILNQTYQEIGIGIAQGEYQGKEAIFVVQMFGNAAKQKVILDNKPTIMAPPALATEEATKPEVKPIEMPKAEVKAAANFAPSNAQALARESLPALSQLKVNETSFAQQDGMLKLTAKFLGDPVKVLAKFGESAVMFLPKSNGVWAAEVKLSDLTKQNAQLNIVAQNMLGQKVEATVGNFSGSTKSNFNIIPTQNDNKVSFMGKIFHPKNFEQQFYLIFIVVLLSCLILAIAIKRHVQHLPLIANTAFVVILAVGLWLR